MGDCDIIHPQKVPETMRAVEFILSQVEKYPDEVELVVLGPATNIAPVSSTHLGVYAGIDTGKGGNCTFMGKACNITDFGHKLRP